MHASTVILISFVTSLFTAVGTAFVVERYEIVSSKAEPTTAETVVPDFKGLSESDARAAAAAAQLTLVVASRQPHATAKVNTVLEQSLPAGQKVPEKQAVNVIVVEELPKVPDVVGTTVESATKRLQDAGYTVQVAGDISDAKVPEGQIARQLPTADSSYVKGAAVTVQLSAGPADVEMPNLVGTGYKAAMERIEALGLTAQVGWISVGETPTYVILNQSPPAGKKLEPGGAVRFTVNR